jgi:hypothetical protein
MTVSPLVRPNWADGQPSDKGDTAREPPFATRTLTAPRGAR